MLLKYRESMRAHTLTADDASGGGANIPTAVDSGGGVNIVRRASILLTPTSLPRPEADKKNVIGQQLHAVEIRSGGVIAFRVPLYQKMLVGGISGVIGLSVVFPIDLIKTRLQLLPSAENVGISSVVRDVLAKHGISGFYRGLRATSVLVAPEKAIKLGVNDYLRDMFCSFDRTKETLAQQVTAGALTGVIQVAVTNPMEIMKIRLQSVDSALTPLQAAKELGWKGLYTGSGVTLLRDVPYNVIFFLSYIEIKRSLTSSDGDISR